MVKLADVPELGKRNNKLTSEIPKNEFLIFQAQREISSMEFGIRDNPDVISYVGRLKALLIELSEINNVFKQEIYENMLLVKELKK